MTLSDTPVWSPNRDEAFAHNHRRRRSGHGNRVDGRAHRRRSATAGKRNLRREHPTRSRGRPWLALAGDGVFAGARPCRQHGSCPPRNAHLQFTCDALSPFPRHRRRMGRAALVAGGGVARHPVAPACGPMETRKRGPMEVAARVFLVCPYRPVGSTANGGRTGRRSAE